MAGDINSTPTLNRGEASLYHCSASLPLSYARLNAQILAHSYGLTRLNEKSMGIEWTEQRQGTVIQFLNVHILYDSIQNDEIYVHMPGVLSNDSDCLAASGPARI